MKSVCHIAIGCLMLVIAIASVQGQEKAKPQPSPSAQQAGPIDPAVGGYLEDSTIAVVHVDLTKVDVPAAVDWFGQQTGGGLAQQATTAKVVGATLVRSLLDAGLSHVYATLSSLDAARGGTAVLLPCRDVAAVKLLVETAVTQVPKELGYQVFTSDGLVVVAQPATWQRIASKPGAGRQALRETLEAGLANAVAVAVNLPDDLRGEISEIWPAKLPEQWMLDLSPKQLMGDVARWTLVADLPPAAAFSVILGTDSEEGTQRTSAALEALATKFQLPKEKVSLASAERTLRLSLDQSLLLGELQQLTAPARMSAVAAAGMNDLKQIMLAMHNFYDAYQFMPPRETRSKTDKPLLSWRVHILPYIEQQALYSQFHLDEPWDSPHNSKLIPQMPAIYAAGGQEPESGKTRLVVPMLEGGAWYGDGPPLTFKEITDGTSNTIAVVIGPKDSAVTWTKPEELPLASDALVEKLFGDSEDLSAAFFDGSVRHVPRSTDPKVIAGMITKSGGEVIPNE